MTRPPGRAATLLVAVLLAAALPAAAQSPPAGTPAAPTVQLAVPATGTPDARTGVDIYEEFVGGLAQPACEDASPRWESHFAHVPAQLAAADSEVLPLFAYVVDALRQAHLPTEYALIPFVESGYRPGARSASGPAGLWQFIALTARNHKIPMRPGFDGRLSPVEATRAAVRYLKTLHGMFAGDWRLAVMAFNAGEYRVLGALKRHDMRAADARPEALASLSGITRAYVVKLHALSCLMVEAGRERDFREALDRPVARLVAIELPADAASLDAFAAREGLDAARLKRLNPAVAPQGTARAGGVHVLVPAAAATAARGAVAN